MKSRFRQITALAAAVATLGVAVIPGFTSNAQDAGMAAAKEAVMAAAASVEEKMEASAAADEAVETYDASVTFPDVKPGDWYYEAVTFATENGIMSGYTDTGKFGPADRLTREQFATVLYRMSGAPETQYQPMFPDVKDGMYYSQAITWAAQNNIITGYTATKKFGVGDYITREQIATILYRYAGSKGEDVDVNAGLYMFPDGDAVSAFAKKGMEYEVYKGHIRGSNGYLNPYSNTNRAEIATMLMRYMEKPETVDVAGSVQKLVNYVKANGEIIDGYPAIYWGTEVGEDYVNVFISYIEEDNSLEFFANFSDVAYTVFYYDVASMTVESEEIQVECNDGTEDGEYFAASAPFDMKTHGINSVIPFTIFETNISINANEGVNEVCNAAVYTSMLGWNRLLAEVDEGLRLNDLGFASYVNLF